MQTHSSKSLCAATMRPPFHPLVFFLTFERVTARQERMIAHGSVRIHDQHSTALPVVPYHGPLWANICSNAMTGSIGFSPSLSRFEDGISYSVNAAQHEDQADVLDHRG